MQAMFCFNYADEELNKYQGDPINNVTFCLCWPASLPSKEQYRPTSLVTILFLSLYHFLFHCHLSSSLLCIHVFHVFISITSRIIL